MKLKRNKIGNLISMESCHDLAPREMAERWKSEKEERCETCLNVNFSGNNGKNVTCKLTGSMVNDVNRINADCPINN